MTTCHPKPGACGACWCDYYREDEDGASGLLSERLAHRLRKPLQSDLRLKLFQLQYEKRGKQSWGTGRERELRF